MLPMSGSNSAEDRTACVCRVLFVNHVSRLGGAEISLLELLTFLDRERFPPCAAVPRPGPLAGRIREMRVPAHTLPLMRLRKTANPATLVRYGASGLVTTVRLLQILRRSRIDLVHANSTTAHLYACLACRIARVPAVWHCRDLVGLGPLGGALAGSAARIIAVSDAVAATVARHRHAASKTVVVHNGVDAQRFSPRGPGAPNAFRAGLGIGPSQVCVGMVAHLVPWKGHRAFLNMAQRVAARRPGIVFVAVGDDQFGDQPGYASELQRAVQAPGLRGRMHLAGYREDIEAVYAGMDILVHPAECEPFGRTVAEAMSMGKPVIAVDAAGPAEIVENGTSGMLVRPGDVGAMADAVEQLAGDPARRAALGAAGRRRIEQRFDVRQTVAGIEAVYQGMMNTQ